MAKFVLIAKTVVEEMLSKLGSGHKLVKTFRDNQETYKSVLKKGFTRQGPNGGRTSKTLEGLNSGQKVAMPKTLYTNMTEATGTPVRKGTWRIGDTTKTPSKRGKIVKTTRPDDGAPTTIRSMGGRELDDIARDSALRQEREAAKSGRKLNRTRFATRRTLEEDTF